MAVNGTEILSPVNPVIALAVNRMVQAKPELHRCHRRKQPLATTSVIIHRTGAEKPEIGFAIYVENYFRLSIITIHETAR